MPAGEANGEVSEPEEFDPFEQEELPPALTTPKTPDGPSPLGTSEPGASGGQIGPIQARWNVVLEELKRARAATTAALLAEAEPIRCDAGTLVIGFRHAILREKWERGDDRQRLAAALKAVFQQSLQVRSEVLTDTPSGSGPTGVKRPAHGGSASAPATPASKADSVRPAANGGPAAPPPGGNGADSLEGQPLLHEVIATFEGQIVDPEDTI